MEATNSAALSPPRSTIGPRNSMLATLPEALGDALGRVVSDVRREARGEIETIKALHRAEFAEFRAQTGETIANLRASADAAVARLDEALSRVTDGRDGARTGPEGPRGAQGLPGADAKEVDPRRSPR